MAYSDNLDDQTKEQVFLVKLTPRWRLVGSDAVLHNNGATFDTYYWTGSKPNVTLVKIDGNTITESVSIPINTTGWFYDETTSRIYIAVSTVAFSGWPNSQVITYEHDLFFATHPTYTYSDPLDVLTDQVEWEPWVREVPQVKRTVSDALVGFIPTTSTNLSIINADQFFNEYLGNASFSKTKISLWHVVGDLPKLQFTSLISDFSTDYNTVNFVVNDDTEVFRNEIRPKVSGESDFYFSSEFPSLDPTLEGAPKRIVYGTPFIKLANLDYSVGTAETDNQEWGVMASTMSESDSLLRSVYDYIDFGVGKTVVGAPTSRIYFTQDITPLFFFGDGILCINGATAWSDPPVYGSALREVLTFNSASKYIDLTSNFTFNQTAGENVYISQIRAVYYGTGQTDLNTARPLRHYYGRKSNGSANIKFLTGYAVSVGRAVLSSDFVFAKVDGPKFQDTDFAAPWDNTIQDLGRASLCAFRGVGIIYEILTNYCGIPTTEINKTSFLTEIARADSPDLSFAIPAQVSGRFPTLQDTLNKLLLSSSILRLHKDDNNKWTISRVESYAAADDTVTDHEIINLRSNFSYRDVYSDIVFKHSYYEINLAFKEDRYQQISHENETAKYLHKIDSTKDIELLVYDGTGGAAAVYFNTTISGTFGSRLAGLFADRSGTHTATVTRKYFGSLINDSVVILRPQISGSAFDEDLKTLTTKVVEINKSQNSVTLTLDDQKGLGDN